MAKKTSFRHDFVLFWPKLGPQKLFLWVLPLLDVVHCCKLSLYAISRKTWENGKKPWFWARFLPIWPKFRLPNFFSKIWLCHSLDIIVSYHHEEYQKKLMIQSWENLVKEGQTNTNDWPRDPPTDGQTEGETEGQEWCHHRTLSH